MADLNPFDQFDSHAAAPATNPFDQFDSKGPSLSHMAEAGVKGAASAAPDILTMPLDLVRLASKAYATGVAKLNGVDSLPKSSLDEPYSEKLKHGISDVAGTDLFSNPYPNEPASRMAHTAGEVVASGGRRAVSMIPAAVGGAVGQELGGALGGFAGAILPTILGARGKLAAPSEPAAAAVESGYSLPPTQIKKTAGGMIGEGLAGSSSVEKKASFNNQPNTDALARKDLGLPENTPISGQVLAQVRRDAGQAYDAVKRVPGAIGSNEAFEKGISSLGQDMQAASREVPELFKNQKLNELQDTMQRISLPGQAISPAAAVETIKKLRTDASANIRSLDDNEKLALGLAQRKAATLLENLVGDNLVSRGLGQLADEWKQARTTIAKAHDYEAALDQHGNIDARTLGRMFDKGAQMSGPQQQIAEFGAAFPRSARTPESMGSDTPQFNLKSIGIRYGIPGIVGGAVGGIPGAIATDAAVLAAPPIARSIILSKPYQRSLARRGIEMNALAPYVAAEQ